MKKLRLGILAFLLPTVIHSTNFKPENTDLSDISLTEDGSNTYTSEEEKGKDYNRIGNALREKDSFEKAFCFHEEARQIFEKLIDEKNVSVSMEGMAKALLLQGDFEKAKKLFEESLEIRERLGAFKKMARTMHNISQCLVGLNNLQEALKFASSSLSLHIEYRGEENIYVALTLNGIAQILRRMGSIDDALEKNRKSLDLYEKIYNNSSHRDFARIYNEIGICYLDRYKGRLDGYGLKDVQMAMGYFDKSIEIKKNLGVSGSVMSSSLLNKGIAHYYLSQYKEALELGEEALIIRKEIYKEGSRAITDVEALISRSKAKINLI